MFCFFKVLFIVLHLTAVRALSHVHEYLNSDTEEAPLSEPETLWEAQRRKETTHKHTYLPARTCVRWCPGEKKATMVDGDLKSHLQDGYICIHTV